VRREEKKLDWEEVIRDNKHTPSVYRRGRIYFLILNARGQYHIPKRLIVTVLIVFICAMMVVLTHAQITGIERQLAQHNRDYRALNAEHRILESSMAGRYTVEEIEYYAFTRLGMTHPDPSQIIEINVPRQTDVRMNREETLLPSENYFWLDIRNFASGLINRVFGSS